MNSLETLAKDVRYAVRGLRKTPGFSAVALLSLVLGIGATTAIFSVIYGVLISPYPYAKSEEIWAPAVRNLKTGQGGHGYTVREFLELQKAPMFADVMATGFQNVLLTGDRAPESLNGVLLSGNAFPFLGVAPVAGRTILPSDVRPNGDPEPVTVLSYLLWQHLFEGDPNAIGKTLTLNGDRHTVIGVMPPRFGWYGNDGLWLPLGVGPREQDRGVNPIMRLQAGVQSEAAAEQLHAMHQRWSAERPASFPGDGFRTSLLNYLDVTVASGAMRSSLLLLFAAVGFLLLIACVNVANLQLARNASRGREIVVRLAIGAGRARLLRQLLTESILLSMIGGALGVGFAVVITRIMVLLMPAFYVPNEARVTLNGYVLLFSAGVSCLTGILSGLTPALSCSRPNLSEALNEGSRGGSTGSAGRRTRSVLLVTEVALAVVLLAGSSLAIRSFLKLQEIDVGFQPDRVLMVNIPLPPAKYAGLDQRNRFAAELLDRVKNLAGVEAAAIGNGGFPFGGPQSNYTIDGRTDKDPQRITVSLISADYPRTMGILLRRGRLLTDSEVARSAPVAVINEAAGKLWPQGADPVGKSIHVNLLENSGSPALPFPPGGTPSVTVVGVINDIRNAGLRNPTAPAIYVPYTLVAPSNRTLAVRTRGEPTGMLNAVRQQVLDLDKEQPIARPITLEEVLGFETVQPRFNMALFSLFAALGLALAMAGVYGVVSYHVARRTHEIGIRISLGALSRDVLALVLSMGARLVLAGLAIGLAASVAVIRLIKTQIFEVAEFDFMSMLPVIAVLCAAAFVACYLPARRASRVDPIVALRHE